MLALAKRDRRLSSRKNGRSKELREGGRGGGASTRGQSRGESGLEEGPIGPLEVEGRGAGVGLRGRERKTNKDRDVVRAKRGKSLPSASTRELGRN